MADAASLTLVSDYGEPVNGTSVASPHFVPLSTIEEEAVRWLWHPYLPLGKLVLIGGDPGIGKSFFTLWLAAQVSSGATMPNGEVVPAANVLVTSAEDDASDTVKPRVLACGGDPRRIISHEEEAENMDELGLQRFEAALKRYDCRLAVMDPFNFFFGEQGNLNAGNHTRAFMTKLKRIARAANCCVLIVTHLNKGRQGNLLAKVLGSVDIGAAVRSMWVAKSMRGMTVCQHVKYSIVGQGPTLSWQFAPREGHPVPSLMVSMANGGMDAEALQELEDEHAATGMGGPRAVERAIDWLREALQPGEEIAVKQLNEQAESNGITRRTLERARAQAGCEAFRRNGAWWVRYGAAE